MTGEPMTHAELRVSVDLLRRHLMGSNPFWLACSIESLLRWDAERCGREPPVWDPDQEDAEVFVARMEDEMEPPREDDPMPPGLRLIAPVEPAEEEPEPIGEVLPLGPIYGPPAPETPAPGRTITVTPEEYRR